MKNRKSRQLKWQHEKKALGLCVQCGKYADGKTRCAGCLKKQKVFNDAYYKDPAKRARLLAHGKRWKEKNKNYIKEWQRQYRLRKKLEVQ